MVVLTAGALWLCDFYTGMRVHPSFARKGAVWSEDERVAAGPRTTLAAAFAPRLAHGGRFPPLTADAS